MKTWIRIPLLASTAVLICLLATVAVFTGAYYYVEPGLPTAQELREAQNTGQIPLRIFSRDGRLMQQYGEQKRTPTDLENIPLPLRNAVIAAEDDRFYEHSGIDVLSTIRAFMNYAISIALNREGRVAGGSTITQQIPRTTNLMSRDYAAVRKLKEIFLAFRIEREFEKDEILELYLNTYFFGQRSFGVAAAARSYFDKDLSELTLSEMAIIAGIPTAPSRNNPYNSPENAANRRRYVLRRMVELGYITEGEREAALAEPIVSQLFDPVIELEAGYVAAMAYQWCLDKFGKESCDTAGLVITTTVDSNLQRTANEALRDALVTYDRNHGYRGPIGRIDLESLDLGSGEAAGDDAASPAATLDTVLSDYPAAFESEAAVVLSVSEAFAEVYLRNTGLVTIGFDAVSWAHRYISDERQSNNPKVVGDVLNPGDIVRFRRREDGALELAQVPDNQRNFVQGALVSLDPLDGAVAALVGGYSFQHSEFNRATQARRQPGSSFKPFFYLSALARNYTLSSVINDAPVRYYDDTLERYHSVENFDGDYYGPTRLREVLINSLNVSATRVILDIGASYVADYVERFGFSPTREERNASLALGSLSVTPLELASAYTVLANGGYAVGIADPETGKLHPYYVQRVEDSNGQLLYDALDSVVMVCPEADASDAAAAEYAMPALIERPSDLFGRLRCAERVESAQRIFLITDVMKDIVVRGSGAAAGRAFRGIRSDLAGKTGTTTGPRDAWFAGFNADIVGVVRVGFDDDQRPLGRSKLGSEQGGVTAIPAWIDFMRVALDGIDNHSLPQPPGIIRQRIDPKTGLIANDCNRDTRWEYFLVENQAQHEPDSNCFAGAPVEQNPELPGGSEDSGPRGGRIFN